jgi:hypothetical protein
MEKRNHIVSIRFTEGEYASQLDRARLAGYDILSFYLRDQLLNTESNDMFGSTINALARRVQKLEDTVTNLPITVSD